MTDKAPGDDALRHGDVDPRELLSAGLISELIVDVRSLANTAAILASELASARAEVDLLGKLRRRDRIGYLLAVATLLVLMVGGFLVLDRNADVLARVEAIEQANRADVIDHRRRNEELHACIVEILFGFVRADTRAERLAIQNPCPPMEAPE